MLWEDYALGVYSRWMNVRESDTDPNQESLVKLVRLERPATQSKSCELAGSKTSAVVEEKE